MLIRRFINWLCNISVCNGTFKPIRSEYWTKGIGFFEVDEYNRKLLKCTKCGEVRYEK
jgi:hypothetical protein